MDTRKNNTPTILLVDDVANNLSILEHMLVQQGYTIRTASNGITALQTMQNELPDLILLDIHMPDMSGYDVCQYIKHDESTAHIPIIFLSPIDHPIDKGRAFAIGCADYIPEPFQREEVIVRVQNQIVLQQTRRLNKHLSFSVDELEQRNREQAMINRMSSFLQRAESSEEAYTVSLPFLRQLFQGQTGALYILNAKTEQLTLMAEWGDPLVISQKQIAASSCWALAGGRVYLIEDAIDDLGCNIHTQPNKRPYICVQLKTRNEMFGILYVQRDPITTSQERNHWTRLALMVADLMALALSNLNLREHLRQQAIRDPLTGLYNRRFLDESLQREITHATRHNRIVGVMMLDIDYFKQFNDTYGHDCGDAVLQTIAIFLQSQVRSTDMVYRFGGEEFTIVFPEASYEHMERRAEELRIGISKIQEKYEDIPLPPATVSIGIACFPMHGNSPEMVLIAADIALYQAKSTGRNKVCVAKNKEQTVPTSQPTK